MAAVIHEVTSDVRADRDPQADGRRTALGLGDTGRGNAPLE